MKKKLLDYDSAMLADFEVRRQELLAKEEYFGALLLIQVLLEVNLKYSIAIKLLNTKYASERMERYWNYSKRPMYLTDLTDYFEILGGDEKVVKRLREFNTLRNKVIHNPFSECETDQQFMRILRKTVRLGDSILEYFHKDLEIRYKSPKQVV